MLKKAFTYMIFLNGVKVTHFEGFAQALREQIKIKCCEYEELVLAYDLDKLILTPGGETEGDRFSRWSVYIVAGVSASPEVATITERLLGEYDLRWNSTAIDASWEDMIK